MPLVSKAQARLMFAAKEGKVPGIKPSVGAEFTDKLEPGDIKALPARKKPPARNPANVKRALSEGRITQARHDVLMKGH